MLVLGYWLVFLSLTVQVLFWYFIFRHLRRPRMEHSSLQPPVSVIICARNESSNLRRNLPLVLDQDYPDYEVVVVDDRSSDDTQSILERFKGEHEHLKVIDNKYANSTLLGKKSALKSGIESAQHDILLLTDADCYPDDKKWICSMVSGLTSSSDVVLGFSPYEKTKGLLNKFIRYETNLIAFQYLGMALLGMPYMAVGRNLMYRKAFFNDINGFQDFGHIASGDDDLLLQKRRPEHRINIVFEKASFVTSIPRKTWGEFIRQKSRHLSTGALYKPLPLLIISLFSLSHFLFFLGLAISFFCNFSTFFVLSLLVTRLLFQLPLYFPLFKRTKSSDLVNTILLLDILFAVLQPVYLMFAVLGRRKKWT